MAKVFLSYATLDKERVRRLAEDLNNRGHEVWLDQDHIHVGDSIPAKIEEGLQGADYVAVALSLAACRSEWVDREWKAKYWQEVEQRRVHVLPLLFEDCDIPGLLKEKRYADFRHSYESGLNELLARLDPKPLSQVAFVARRRELALELLEDVHSRDNLLSLNMMNVLKGSATLQDRDIESFCRSELAGYDSSGDVESEQLAHRRIAGYVSFAEINTMFMGWGDNLSNALQYMRRDPKTFVPGTLVFEQSLSRIEADLPSFSPKKLVFLRLPAKGFSSKAKESAEVVFYAAGDALSDVYERIRAQLIARLSRLI